MQIQKRTLSVYLSIGTIILWALANVFTRVALAYYTPRALAVLRYVLASTALAVYVFIRKSRLPALRDVPVFLLSGASGFALYMYTFNQALQTVTASTASFVLSASPVMTAVLARFVLKERIGLVGWLSVGLSFSGIAIITLTNGIFPLGPGVPWICAAAACISLYNIFQRKLLTRYTSLESTAYSIFSGTLLMLAFLPEALPALLSAPVHQLLTLAFLGIFPAAIAYILWSAALSHAEKTSDVTNFMFLSPLLTTLLGFVVIREIPPVTTFVGGVVVLAGLVLMNASKKIGRIQPEPSIQSEQQE